jgi:hypothetical protein
MPPSSRQRQPIKRRIVAAFTERLPLKLAAAFFSLVLWFIVAAEEPAAREMSVRLALTTDSAVTVGSDLPSVHALVVGSGRDLLKLYATPPTVRRHLGEDSPDTVVLEIRPSDVDLPSGVNVRVQDVQPRSIPVVLAVRQTRAVPVRSALQIVAPPGMRVTGGPRFEPESVEVSGRRRFVSGLDAVLTRREELVVPDTGTAVVPLDTAGLRVRVSPAAVRVHVPVARVEPALPTPLDSSGVVGDSASAVIDSGARARPDSAPRPRATRPDSARRNARTVRP